MPSPFSFTTSKEPLPQEVALIDALISLQRVLELIGTSGEAIEIVERRYAGREMEPADVAMLLDAVDDPVPMLPTALHTCTRGWIAGGDRSFRALEPRFRSIGASASPQNWSLLELTCDALAAIADVTLGDADDAPFQASRALLQLACQLELTEQHEVAGACALSGLNFMPGLEDRRVLPFTETALRILRRAGDSRPIFTVMLRRALALAAAAGEDESLRLETFDSFASLMRYLPAMSAELPGAEETLDQWLEGRPFLAPLETLRVARWSDERRRDFPFDPDEFTSLLEPVWDLSSEEFPVVLQRLTPWMVLEDRRLELEPPVRDVAAEASWVTWSIRHRSFVRAIPQGVSILREKSLDDLLLVLHHEIAHVYSLFSAVGLTATALRAALLDTEAGLWIETPMRGWTGWVSGPAPLEAHEVGLLAGAEQSLEISRKLQIVEQVWTPWLEGLAVYGELAADPTAEDEVRSAVAQVVGQLVDVHLEHDVQERGGTISDAAARLSADAEKRYAETIARTGATRLRLYLDRYPGKYLAGYLTVRSVVSAWRRRLGRPLSGAEAFRMLLHVMRYSTADAIPDLSLPVAELEERAREGVIDWLEWCTSLGAEALTATSSGAANAYDGDRAITLTREELQARTSALLDERYAQVRDAGLSEYVHGWLDQAVSIPLVMPMAQVSCPFWLNRPTRSLVVVVRTTEDDYQHGRSSYQIVSEPLEQEEFDALEEVARTHGVTRLAVTRFADLIEYYDEQGGRVPGVHYVAYGHDEWMHVVPRGLLVGKRTAPATLVEQARKRLLPNPVFEGEEALSDRGAVACAERTKAWLDSAEGWTLDGDTADPGEWVDRVRALADEVIAGADPADDAEMSTAMLEFALGDQALASRLRGGGLASVAGDPPDIRPVIAALQASGLSPAASDWLDSEEGDPARGLFARQDDGWDVVPGGANGGGR